MLIQSTRNPTVKLVRSLLTKKGRRETGLHLIEGERLVAEAVSSGAEIDSLFVEEGREPVYCPNGSVYQVTRHVLESMTDTDNPQSVCAAVKTPNIKLPDEYPEGLIVALDCVDHNTHSRCYGCCGAAFEFRLRRPIWPKGAAFYNGQHISPAHMAG